MSTAAIVFFWWLAVGGQKESRDLLAAQQWFPTWKTNLRCEVTGDRSRQRSGDSILEIIDPSGKRLKRFSGEGDAFIGMYLTDEVGGNLVTVWSGGSAYHIRVWHYESSANEVTLVLDEGSRFLPELTDIDGDGSLEISITNDRRIDPKNPNVGLRGSKTTFLWKESSRRYIALGQK